MKILLSCLVLSIMGTSLISAQTMSEIQACKDSYYFVISHLDTSNSLVYSQQELLELSNQLSKEINQTVNPIELEPYVKFYQFACNFSDLKIPSYYFYKNETSLRFNPVGENKLGIDKSLLGYDLDSSLPFFHISIQSTDKVKYLKYLFLIENADYGWEITGVKFYWIFLSVSLVFVVMFIRSNRYLNNQIRRLK